MVEMPSGYYYFRGYDMSAKELAVLMAAPGKHHKLGRGGSGKSFSRCVWTAGCLTVAE